MQNNIELMGTTTKTVKGRTYLYFTYYDPNTKSKKKHIVVLQVIHTQLKMH